MEAMAPELLWIALAGLLIGPFVQEDLAVIGAASLSLMHPAMTPLILALIMAGLWASDVWKYLPGKLARDKGKTIDPLARPRLAATMEALRARPGKTLMTVRFIPFARIAAYIAAGYAGVAFLRFAFWIAVSGALYIGVIFGLFHALGAVMAEQAKVYLPLIGLGFAALWLTAAAIKRKRP